MGLRIAKISFCDILFVVLYVSMEHLTYSDIAKVRIWLENR